MLFRSTIFALIAAFASAESMVPDFSIPTTSNAGKRLLSKARQLENNNNNQDQDDASWMTGYSIKYDSCSSLIQVREDGGAEEGILYAQNLVKFVVCKGNSGCGGCGNGAAQYVVNMRDFVETYSQMKQEMQEQACETVKDSCYCENANDDEYCEKQCYQAAGMSQCIQNDNGGEEQDVAALMECAALGDGGNNGYQQYYVGPKCAADGKSIHLAVFKDAGCVSYAGSGIYEKFTYGYSLPYEKESIIAKNECISCLQVDQDNENGNYNYNNNYNQGNYGEVSEICQNTYQAAVKCEKNLKVGQYFYPDTSGCEFINHVLPTLASTAHKISGGALGFAAGSAATVFAVIFGLTTALLGAYAFFLYRKIHRAKINLALAESTMA